MGHYKNRKPKSFKGHCGMCCIRYTDGRRNGRLRTRAERRAEIGEREQRAEAVERRDREP